MNFKQAVTSCFQNYVGFSGRAPRSEYWFFYLFLLPVFFVTGVLDFLIAPNSEIQPVTIIALLAVILPMIAVSVRRLHDGDRSGWWYLLAFVPLVGGIIILIWFCMRGTVGSNRFGPDPLEGKVL